MKIINTLKKYSLVEKIPFYPTLILILVTIIFILFYSRQIFFFHYEPEYYENLYYHSQWNIPNSPRGISDGMLYKFVGYRLVQGENTFYLNFEVPPFGKYLYGLFEYFIGNPYLLSLLLYLGTIVVFYLLSLELFVNKKLAVLTTFILTTTPFIATQVRDTMLDLPLTFLFLSNIFFFAKYLKRQRLIFLALAGLFLGLATGTKIGVYTPLILLLGLFLVFWASKSYLRLLNPMFYLGSVFAGYCLAYISYFIHHPNPLPWLKLHQKQLDFYLGPSSDVDYLNQWKGIFLNTYQGWWGIDKISLGDWSPILPLGVLSAVVVLILAIKRKEKNWIYIAGMTIVFLIVNTLISFWPRYLMPAIPGFVLLISYFGRKFWLILLIIAFLNLPFLVNSMTVKNYNSNSEAVSSFIAKRAYRELYRSINPVQRKSLPEDQFIETLEKFYETLGVRKIEAQTKSIEFDRDVINVKYDIKYFTDYGELTFTPEFEFHNIHNEVMVNWKWDYLWPAYNPEDQIVIENSILPVAAIRRGGNVVARPGKAEKLYIITRHVQWPQTLDVLSELTGKNTLVTGDTLHQVVPDDFPRFVGMLNGNLGEEGKKKALDVKGAKLFNVEYLVPEPNSAKHDIYKLIYKLNDERPELFYVNADIYFENNGTREYILKSDPAKKDIILDL